MKRFENLVKFLCFLVCFKFNESDNYIEQIGFFFLMSEPNGNYIPVRNADILIEGTTNFFEI